MIRKSSVALGEIVVVGGGMFRPSQLIQGLNDESYGAVPYTDNFREEIPQQTTEGAYHSETMELTSDRLAEIIRGAMYNVRDYGVPLAKKIAEGTSMLYSPDRLQQVANEQFLVEFVNVEDPFFDSPLYPKEIRDKSLSYTGISLDMVKNLKFDWATDDQVRTFIASNHPDLLAIVDNNEESLNFAAQTIGNLDELREVFENNDGVFNFTKVKSTRINLLLKMYILLTKMYATDDPAPWLKGGDLSTYRSFVNLMWNGLTAYLLQLRNVVGTYKQLQLVVTQDKAVGLQDHAYESYKGVRFMGGKVRAYYTNAMMAKITAAGVGFQEMILGYFYGNMTGSKVSMQQIIENPALGCEQAKNYYFMINDQLTKQAQELFVAGGLKAIAEHVSSIPEVAERALAVRTKQQVSPDSWYISNFKALLDHCYHLIAAKCPGDMDLVADDGAPDTSREDVILSTKIVPTFLYIIGCKMAAEIVDATFTEIAGEDSAINQRERLHVSLINLIVNHSIEPVYD
jgi:hypothetical protein